MVIAGVAVVLVALLALLLTQAYKPLAQALEHLFDGAPFPIDHLGSFIGHTVETWGRWLTEAFDHLVKPLATFILAPVVFAERLAYGGLSAAFGLATAVWWTVDTYVPREVARAGRGTLAAVTHLAARLTADVRSIEARITRDVKYLDGKIGHEVRAAESAAAAGISHEAARITADVSALGRKIATAEVDTLAKAKVAATTAATAAVGVLGADIGKALADTWPDVITAADGAIAAAGTGLADVTDALRAIPRAVPTSVVEAIAAVTGVSVAATRLAEDCTIPNCRNLSGLGQDLLDLLGVLEDGAFLAMIAALVADPAGTSREVADVLTPIADTAIGAGKSLLGVG